MNRLLAPALVASCLAALLATGCKDGAAKKLEGRWRGTKASGVASDQADSANLFASKMALEFHGDMVSVFVGDQKQSGHFRVVQDDKTSVVLFTDQDGPTQRETFTFVDGQTMTWAMGRGQTIQFQKE